MPPEPPADRLRVPRLLPFFGCLPFTPLSACPHHGPIPSGSVLYCPVCHQSGQDHHPGMRETAADALRVRDWKPEDGRDQWTVDLADTSAAEPTAYRPEPATKPTRRERRESARQGRNSVPAEPMDPRRLARAIDAGHAVPLG